MSTKRERLRAGVALLEAAIRMLEQTKTEFGSTSQPSPDDLIIECIAKLKAASIYAVRIYDKAKP